MSKKERVKVGEWKVSETKEGRLQDWLSEWDKGCWDFIYTEPGPMLAKHFESVTEGKKGLKILVPLSATAYDLIWLCDQGHTVVGADLAESAAQRMFKQYKQEPIVEDVPSINGKVYKNAAGTFKYYVGNFFLFNLNLEGTFDFIWDSKAMCAVDERDRDEYLRVMRSLMGPTCSLMVEFPQINRNRPPYHFTKEQLESYYGDRCEVTYLGDSVFDLTKAVHGDLDTDGKPIKEKDSETTDEKDKGNTSFVLDCYSLKSKN